MWNLFDSPRRGLTQLVFACLASAYYFFGTPVRRETWGFSPFQKREPSYFEQFQSGSPSDFVVLFTLFLIIWIVFAIATVIVDYRATGRLW
jgi:hypothetical protein